MHLTEQKAHTQNKKAHLFKQEHSTKLVHLTNQEQSSKTHHWYNSTKSNSLNECNP